MPPLKLTVTAYGLGEGTIQAMWNAVDCWVRRCSNFYSLFELYGHFTEPHPVFTIESFESLSNHPVARFAEHAANFSHCSRYFPKSHLVKLFSRYLNTKDFNKIAEYLRKYRFDIRSKETNIAIEADSYMVAYPFNLPSRRQMNFRVHNRETMKLKPNEGENK
jgi:DNA (cytosine-5)-methyltransferase 1